MFKEPKGMPPKIIQEHVIHIVEGHGPVNVRPYLYSHYHKNEIEKQVKEMFEANIVRASQSTFSSSVILVKNDNLW